MSYKIFLTLAVLNFAFIFANHSTSAMAQEFVPDANNYIEVNNEGVLTFDVDSLLKDMGPNAVTSININAGISDVDNVMVGEDEVRIIAEDDLIINVE